MPTLRTTPGPPWEQQTLLCSSCEGEQRLEPEEPNWKGLLRQLLPGELNRHAFPPPWWNCCRTSSLHHLKLVLPQKIVQAVLPKVLPRRRSHSAFLLCWGWPGKPNLCCCLLAFPGQSLLPREHILLVCSLLHVAMQCAHGGPAAVSKASHELAQPTTQEAASLRLQVQEPRCCVHTQTHIPSNLCTQTHTPRHHREHYCPQQGKNIGKTIHPNTKQAQGLKIKSSLPKIFRHKSGRGKKKGPDKGRIFQAVFGSKKHTRKEKTLAKQYTQTQNKHRASKSKVRSRKFSDTSLGGEKKKGPDKGRIFQAVFGSKKHTRKVKTLAKQYTQNTKPTQGRKIKSSLLKTFRNKSGQRKEKQNKT